MQAKELNETMTSTSFQKITNNLIGSSIANGVNAFELFEWPKHLEDDKYWFSPDALSVAHTEKISDFSEQQLISLSKWECINSFSLNTLGECELIQSLTNIMGQLKLGDAHEYLYHFISEENQHMWYFQKFCKQYAGKVYPSLAIPVEQKKIGRSLNHFLVFARIVLFEEIGHYYNILNSKDERVHPFVRDINRAHYNDEARHITFGRRVIRELAEEALTNDDNIVFVNGELSKTLMVNFNALYNPSMYRDAGIESAMALRADLIGHPRRQDLYKNKVLKGANQAFTKIGLTLSFPGDQV